MAPAAGRLSTASTPSLVGLGFGSVVVGLGVLLPDLGVGPEAATPVSVAVGALVLVAAFVGAYALGRGRTTDPVSGVDTAPSKSERLLHRSLAIGALSVMVATVVFPLSVDLSAGLPERLLVHGLLWFGLGLAVLQLLHGRRAGGRFAAGPVLLIVPAAMVAAAAASAAVGRSLTPAVDLLTIPLTVVGAIGIVVVPGLLISAAVTGLQDAHDATRGLTRLSVDRPRTVLLILVANLVLVAAVWGLGSALSPGTRLWDWGLASWLASAVCAALIMIMLTVERRIALRAGDHATVAPAAGVLVAAPIAALVLVFVGAFLGGIALDHPLSLAGLAIVPVGVLALYRHVRSGVPRLLMLAGLAVAAAGLATVPTPPLPPAAALREAAQHGLGEFGTVVALVIAALSLAAIGIVVVACLFRQTRLLVYLAAVAGWVLITALLSLWTDATVLNLDVALIVLLALATLLWLVGRQRAIDGYEVVLTVVVTASLWLVPLALDLVPSPVGDWLVAGVLLLPAFGSLRTHLRGRKRNGPTAAATGRLGLTCLMYGLLAALVWVVGASPVTLSDDMVTEVSKYVLPPLGLLLILTASAGRAPAPPVPAPTRTP